MLTQETIQLLLTDIQKLVSLDSVILPPDRPGKQFLFVGFSMMLDGYDVQPLSLESLIGFIQRNDMTLARVLHAVQYATVIENTDNHRSLARIEDYLAGKLQRPRLPYPIINDQADHQAFTWTTTVNDPEQFIKTFPQSKALNAPVYDLLYVFYILAKYNDLLGVFGPSIVNQVTIQLRQDSQFQCDLFDKLLALSNVLNKRTTSTH